MRILSGVVPYENKFKTMNNYDKPRRRNYAEGKGRTLKLRIVNIGDPNRTILEKKIKTNPTGFDGEPHSVLTCLAFPRIGREGEINLCRGCRFLLTE
jgi:hypothetical protein